MDEFNHDPREDKDENKYIVKIKKGLAKLVDKDGFYIILFLCICILGTTAIWVATRGTNSSEDMEEISNEDMDVTEYYYSDPSPLEDINTLPDLNDLEANAGSSEEENDLETEDHSEVEVVNIEETTNTEEQTQEVQETKTSSAQTEGSQSYQQNRVISMILPANGAITKEFAMDKLVYSKTLEQWTTHNGVDIAAREGSVVRAALDGVVTSIKNDDELGIVIALDHGGGITTLYACLSTDEMVKEGQSVKKGETISGVGKGVGFELAQGPHLHFEVLIDGKNVDPTQYIPSTQ